jgi:hypothetical protein
MHRTREPFNDEDDSVTNNDEREDADEDAPLQEFSSDDDEDPPPVPAPAETDAAEEPGPPPAAVLASKPQELYDADWHAQLPPPRLAKLQHFTEAMLPQGGLEVLGTLCDALTIETASATLADLACDVEYTPGHGFRRALPQFSGMFEQADRTDVIFITSPAVLRFASRHAQPFRDAFNTLLGSVKLQRHPTKKHLVAEAPFRKPAADLARVLQLAEIPSFVLETFGTQSSVDAFATALAAYRYRPNLRDCVHKRRLSFDFTRDFAPFVPDCIPLFGLASVDASGNVRPRRKASKHGVWRITKRARTTAMASGKKVSGEVYTHTHGPAGLGSGGFRLWLPVSVPSAPFSCCRLPPSCLASAASP